ncbi:MAG: cob(I)yrinic acid a,c-diamide adenosyltransferase [Phycisphaerales bacterium JB039]
MVRLTKIYTRTGDSGQTGLGSGARVSKASLRVEAYGAVDEANAAIGMAVLACAAAPDGAPALPLADLLRSTQHDLFDAGADLCFPVQPGEPADSHLRITTGQTERLERVIDEYNADLPALTSFTLPGGTEAGARLHVARTTVRRAERLCVALLEAEPEATSPEVIRYLNRLSDLLFVLSRVANDKGAADVLWKPGASREPPP